MARRQDRLGTVGGCHLNRPIDHLVADAGFELTRLSTYYHKRPSADGYTFKVLRDQASPKIRLPPHPRSFVPTGAVTEADVERRKREGRCPCEVTYGSTRGGTQELSRKWGRGPISARSPRLMSRRPARRGI